MADDPTKRDLAAQQGSAEQATPDAEASTRLSAGMLFRSPHRLQVVDSTNRYAADLARDGAPEGTTVLAERQTAGRGRLGRRWADVAGGSVLCSVLFRPQLPLGEWHVISWLVALAARDACADAAAVELTCKWPNDLQAGERKVAGLLAEVVWPPAEGAGSVPTTGGRGEGPGLVVGIGINCNWPADWPPRDDPDATAIIASATSLDRVAGLPVDRDAVADRLLDRVAQRYAVLTSSPAGARSMAAEYRRNLSTIGRVVRVELADESFVGRALDVNDDGHLLVDIGACIRAVAAGDVVHLR
ncbi:MAG: biotin--[acetyl-CoA-carboxylase] ligase [Acidimicrobiales bacterium]|jgi:BirA family biotin operon repressor/biotin-[acetyl-CoA-carboxylase] ligase